jgi:hypothetical protein
VATADEAFRVEVVLLTLPGSTVVPVLGRRVELVTVG